VKHPVGFHSLPKYGGENKPSGRQWGEMDLGRRPANSLIDEAFDVNTVLFPKLEYVTNRVDYLL
jgi:hypothetical protein